jgi:hypothetical protein
MLFQLAFFCSHHSMPRLTNAQPQPKVYIELYVLFYFCDISNFTLIVLFYLNVGTGIYAFKVHGQIYHKIDQLIPGGKGPRHMQLYMTQMRVRCIEGTDILILIRI